jgi:hypothetical protein
MEPTKGHMRFYIYTLYELGIRARPIYEKLLYNNYSETRNLIGQ